MSETSGSQEISGEQSAVLRRDLGVFERCIGRGTGETFYSVPHAGEPLRSVEEPAGFFPSAVLIILCPLSVPARREPGENGRTDSAESQH